MKKYQYQYFPITISYFAQSVLGRDLKKERGTKFTFLFLFFRYTQLNIVEKIILSMVHFMLSNKIARLFVFAYILLLHCLVFLVLMSMAYSDSYRRDHAISEWQQKYADHMLEAHQENHIG